MRHTLLILSHLLRYPSEEVRQAAPELVMALELDGVLESSQIEEVKPLVQSLIDDELLDLQEGYSSLFDRGRALSLHLFEHVHGESRDRGQAMVDLQTMYVEKGLEPGTSELPDFLPLFLEFASMRPPAATNGARPPRNSALDSPGPKNRTRGYCERARILCAPEAEAGGIFSVESSSRLPGFWAAKTRRIGAPGPHFSAI